MKFLVDKQEKYTLFQPEEEKIDSTVAPSLKAEFITLFQSGTVNLLLNMEHIKYVDSSGLSALLMAQRMAQNTSGLLVLAALNPHVNKLIRISKLDAVFEILPTVAEGIDTIFLSELEKDIKASEEE